MIRENNKMLMESVNMGGIKMRFERPIPGQSLTTPEKVLLMRNLLKYQMHLML